MKKIVSLVLCAALSLVLLASCGKSDGDLNETTDAYTGPWLGFSASFAREAASQYSNATLQVKYLENGVVLFEFCLMEGSEAEDEAEILRIPGTMLAEDDHIAVYDSLNEDGTADFTIEFVLAEDGQAMTVTHTGDILLSPDGTYEYTDAFVEVSEGTARALIENLPAAATSLNGNLGAYSIGYPEECVLNYFYPVTATFDETEAVLAQFIVTNDLSAVYRLDTEDGVPVLIYGEAQTMLDQVVYLSAEELGEDEEVFAEAIPLLPVIVADGTLLEPGANSRLALDAPYPFACTFKELLSTDDDIAAVSADGTIQAVAPGMVTITGDIVVDDGSKAFSIEVFVGGEGEAVSIE